MEPTRCHAKEAAVVSDDLDRVQTSQAAQSAG